MMTKKIFEAMCISAKTPNDIRTIVQVVVRSMEDYEYDIALEFCAKRFYNTHVGWALPTPQVCDLVVKFWKLHASSKVVDMGCGSGLFCLMLHDCGIPKDKLLALETKVPPKTHQTTNVFWDIVRDDEYEIDTDDIAFVAWGSGISKRLQSYVERGGKYVIILGETGDGCTFPSDWLKDNKEWDCTLTHVQGPASNFAEHLSINVRKVGRVLET